MEIQKGNDGYKSYKMVTNKKQKGLSNDNPLRGPERIRTAVEAFAELCLATRPQDLVWGCKNSGKKGILKF